MIDVPAVRDGSKNEATFNGLFEAAVEAVNEAVLNSLFESRTTIGRKGRIVYALPIDNTMKILLATARFRVAAVTQKSERPPSVARAQPSHTTEACFTENVPASGVDCDGGSVPGRFH
jgi:hypothetical protein